VDGTGGELQENGFRKKKMKIKKKIYGDEETLHSCCHRYMFFCLIAT
jgi:hypothetical protein